MRGIDVFQIANWLVFAEWILSQYDIVLGLKYDFWLNLNS